MLGLLKLTSDPHPRPHPPLLGTLFLCLAPECCYSPPRRGPHGYFYLCASLHSGLPQPRGGWRPSALFPNVALAQHSHLPSHSHSLTFYFLHTQCGQRILFSPLHAVPSRISQIGKSYHITLSSKRYCGVIPGLSRASQVTNQIKLASRCLGVCLPLFCDSVSGPDGSGLDRCSI